MAVRDGILGLSTGFSEAANNRLLKSSKERERDQGD